MLSKVEKTDIKVTDSHLTAVNNIDIFQANNVIKKFKSHLAARLEIDGKQRGRSLKFSEIFRNGEF